MRLRPEGTDRGLDVLRFPNRDRLPPGGEQPAVAWLGKARVKEEDDAAIRYDVFGERIGPAEGEENPDAENAADAASDSPGPRDEFEHDDIDEADRQHELETEHDFEDGEEVDYDEADEPDEP